MFGLTLGLLTDDIMECNLGIVVEAVVKCKETSWPDVFCWEKI